MKKRLPALWCWIHFGVFKRTCLLLLPLTFFSPGPRPSPPSPKPWSIRPRLPVPHVIFFFSFLLLWHSSSFHPPPTAWYSGVGMHAPSQIHQLRSECRTTARVNRGMRGGGRERGRRGQVSGLSTSFRDQSLKLTGREREELEKTRGKGNRKSSSLFFFWCLWGHFC